MDIRTAVWLGLALLLFYLLTTSAHQPTGDEEEYVAVAENILTRGTLAIVTPSPGTDGRSQFTESYSKFALGQSLLLLPVVALQMITRAIVPVPFAFLPHLVLNFLPVFESAATCALVFLLFRLNRLGPDFHLSRSTAATAALLTGIATQMWPSSRTLFADNSVALLLTLAVYSLARFHREDGGIGWAVTAAWAAAITVLCKTLFALACPALAAYGIWAATQKNRQGKLPKAQIVRLASLAALPFLLVGATQLQYNYLRYGSIWLSGYHQGRDGDFGFSTPILVGLYGIFLSSGRSLFLYSPLCLLAFLGFRDFFKHAKAEFLLIAGASLPVVLAYAKWWSWHGGWEWGTRFYLFLIPLLMWLSVPAWRWLDQKELSLRARNLRKVALAFLISISVFIQLLGILIHPIAYWKMTASDLNVLQRPVYEKGVWEIRDDMPLAHFVPEFSPVAAHAWLIWATWNRNRLDEETLAAHAPWTSLNPKWAPTNVKSYLGYDVWFIGDWIGPWLEHGGSLGSMILFALLLAGMSLFSGFKLRSYAWRSPPSPSRKA
ncbi:MAG: hypothetical protein ACM3TN_11350 [Alphaproteobacteria bacterium]